MQKNSSDACKNCRHLVVAVLDNLRATVHTFLATHIFSMLLIGTRISTEYQEYAGMGQVYHNTNDTQKAGRALK